ncbi:hypothetical protein COY27_05995 [Candidatus Woesearchaeota archaeon CG_4_10_14_0_2_um_filter_33_13]|nr:MAG: hypothetical protein COY27_05995 [Candidatus Woesearchaeota archaeon CG_4_10_14_0_2_um_filter_33_13]
MVIKFSLAKCKTRAAFSTKLLQKGKINLSKIKVKFKVLLETPILLVVDSEAGEIIIHSHGELLFKNCKDVVLIEKTAKTIYDIGLS